MSAEDAQKFLDAVDTNPELQNSLKEMRSNWVKLGKEHGYDFTVQELSSHVGERWGVSKPPEYDDPDSTCAV